MLFQQAVQNLLWKNKIVDSLDKTTVFYQGQYSKFNQVKRGIS